VRKTATIALIGRVAQWTWLARLVAGPALFLVVVAWPTEGLRREAQLLIWLGLRALCPPLGLA
jgi:hypothetical protein